MEGSPRLASVCLLIADASDVDLLINTRILDLPQSRGCCERDNEPIDRSRRFPSLVDRPLRLLVAAIINHRMPVPAFNNVRLTFMVAIA